MTWVWWSKFLIRKFSDSRRHCVKSVQIWSFFWSVFSCIWTEYGNLFRKSLYWVQIQENADQKKLRILKLFTQWEYLELSRAFTTVLLCERNSKCYNCWRLTVYLLLGPEIFHQLESVMKKKSKRFKEEKYQCACLSSVLLYLLLHARKDISRQTKKSHFNTI